MNLTQRAAFCPHCGSALRDDSPCPNDGYRWFPDPKVGVGVLVTREGRLLLVQRAHEPATGRWTFPSGFVDAGEVLEEAAAREIREETGIEVRIDRLLGAWSVPGDPVIFLAYAATDLGGTLAASVESSDVAWFDLDALPPLAFEHDPEIVASWQAERSRESSARATISLLQQRGIEADVLVPFIRRMEADLGRERAHALAREVIESIAREQGHRVAEALGRADIEGFTEVKDSWGGAGGDLAIETLHQDEGRLEFNVVGCRFAEMYRRMGAEDLGVILSCTRDFALSDGYSGALHLERTQTIMQGAAFCDFRYRLVPAGEDTRGSEDREDR